MQRGRLTRKMMKMLKTPPLKPLTNDGYTDEFFTSIPPRGGIDAPSLCEGYVRGHALGDGNCLWRASRKATRTARTQNVSWQSIKKQALKKTDDLIVNSYCRQLATMRVADALQTTIYVKAFGLRKDACHHSVMVRMMEETALGDLRGLSQQTRSRMKPTSSTVSPNRPTSSSVAGCRTTRMTMRVWHELADERHRQLRIERYHEWLEVLHHDLERSLLRLGDFHEDYANAQDAINDHNAQAVKNRNLRVIAVARTLQTFEAPPAPSCRADRDLQRGMYQPNAQARMRMKSSLRHSCRDFYQWLRGHLRHVARNIVDPECLSKIAA